MYKYQNLHLADKSLFEQYRGYFKANNITAALAILSESQLTTKLLLASQLNSAVINDTYSIAALENYYNSEVPQTLASMLETFNDAIGELKYLGTYSSSATYTENNVVAYNNELYYCKVARGQTITNVAPTDTTKWVGLNLRGIKGVPGLGVTLRGIWDSTTQYQTKDVVAYRNYLYVATQASYKEIPVSTSAYWTLLADYDITRINFSDTNLEVGDIYWQEVS